MKISFLSRRSHMAKEEAGLRSDIVFDSTSCPSCGRYVGLVRTCRYCDCDVPVSPALRCLKVMSFVLGVGGLAMLVMMTRANDIPKVRISSINPLMDYAVVCVEGTVARKPYVSSSKGKRSCVSFVISDGSGELRVTAYREVALKMIEQGAVPSRGSSISVFGRISISRGGEPKLVLSSAQGINILQEG